MTALVRCDGVARTFGTGPTAVVAVRRVTCQIDAGQRVAVIGPSGSGKSTLLHLLAGLDEPTVGQVSWPGLGPREALRPGPVAVVFQGPCLLPGLDVIENVALPLILAGRTERAARVASLAALDRLDLRSIGAKLPDELSGGQAQRVAMARALAGEPRLILADEPTGQLDYEHANAVVDGLLRAAAQSGAAVVLSTHDARIAERMPSRWRMADGELLGPAAPSVAGAPSSR